MASRKEQKEQARQARIAAEQAAKKKAQQQRLGMIAGVGVIAAIVVVLLIVLSSTSGKKNVVGQHETGLQKSKPQSAQTYKTVAKELAGIPQHGNTLGNPKAKVNVQYFGDLECPICQAFTLGADGGGLPQLISGPVKQGKIKLTYRAFCTATNCPANQSTFNNQQVAAEAAGKQNLFWDYAELFYHEQGKEDSGYVNEAYLTGLAKQIPKLKLGKWNSDRKDPSLVSQIKSDNSAASADKIQGTPSLVAVGPKGTTNVPAPTGIPTYSQITGAVQNVS